VRVAVLGTGAMGAPMARNLLAAGHDVAVWNRSRAKAEAIEGVHPAGSPALAVEGAELVITMLSDGDAVERTIANALPSLDRGTVWAQMSTVGLHATERFARLAQEHGLEYVDAPVLGTRAPAEQGELIVLGAASQAVRKRCEPVFEAIAKRTLWVGEPPTGTKLKLVVNTWIIGLVETLAETVALARDLGLDPATFLEVIEGEPFDSRYAQIKGKAMIEGEFPPSVRLALALKDAGLVLEAAEIQLPLVQTVAEQFQQAFAAGHGDEDMAAVIHATLPGGSEAAA
jgi:3-hydroxyisobutyrate dehydrogenase